MARAIALGFIRLYQLTLSPDHGMMRVFFRNGYCKFHPTCSAYCFGSIKRYGTLKGSWMGFTRLLRCNPWSKGGNDPVPEQKTT